MPVRYSTRHGASRRLAWLLAAAALLAAGCATQPGATRSATAEAAEADAVPPALRAQYRDAQTLLSVEDYDGAAQLLESTVAAYPQYPEAATTLAIVYRRQGRAEASLALLQQTLAVHDDFAAAWNEVGILHREAGRFDEAESAYLKAVTVRPEYGLAHLNLGILYDLYLGRLDDALLHYERYQAQLGDGQDQMVGRWIADVSRRIQRTAQTAQAQ
jgi:tetratricopeptide (TPR) repeat protein